MISKVSCATMLLIVPSNDYQIYSKYEKYVMGENTIISSERNKSSLEYNIINSQDYIDSLIYKSFYSPVIDELEKE
jgi:hypothetical protein